MLSVVGGARFSWGSLVAVLVAVLVGASVAGATPGSSSPLKIIPSCSRFDRSPIVFRSRSGRVIVRRARVREDGGLHDWACPPSGAAEAWPVGGSPPSGFASGERVRDFVSAGPWLVDVVDSRGGWTNCLRPSPAQRCRRYHHEIELVDIADEGGSSTQSGADVDIHLSTLRAHNGDQIAAVVWTQPAAGGLVRLEVLTDRDHRGPGGSSLGFGFNKAVTGKIDPESVRLRGLRVSFLENGRHRSLRLAV
jgi:hypothetical protein